MRSTLTRWVSLSAWALAVVAFVLPLHAGPPAKPPPAQTAAPSAAAASPPAGAAPPAGEGDEGGSGLPWREGPTALDLGRGLTIDLPPGYVFLAQPEAGELMKRMGNLHNENLLGLVASKVAENQWLVVVRYEESGYIRDDEEVDADALLKAIKEGTEEANEERAKQGFRPLIIDGWAEPPRYDRALHHLVWAMNAHSDDGTSVNYNTRMLGRRGFVSLNLVTDGGELAKYKPEATKLLSATRFGPGSRYEEFDEKRGDKAAEYGLAGLVLGGAGLGAAKLVKIGLLAKFWKLILTALIAGKKFVVIAAVAAAGLVKRLFGRKSEPAD